MRGHISSRLTTVLLVLIAFASHAQAADWVVAATSGSVTIRSAPVQAASLSVGMKLKGGSVLIAGNSGRALLVHDGDQMIVSPNSIVAIPKGGNGAFTTVLEGAGVTEFDVSKRSTPHFSVETPYLVAVVKGTHFTVRVSKGRAMVTVQRGRVEVRDLQTGQHVDVLPGQRAIAIQGRHLMIDGEGTLMPILRGVPRAPVIGSPGQTQANGLGGISNSIAGTNIGAGGTGLNANIGGLVGASVGAGGINAGVGSTSVSVGGGNGVSASVGGGAVSASVSGSGGVNASVGGSGGINASVGGGGVGVSVGGLHVGVGLH